MSTIHLVLLDLANEDGAARQVSVWVRTEDGDLAVQQAKVAMAGAGWPVAELLDLSTTDDGDYFRACPSQQAYLRAIEEGIAWRYADE